MRNSDNNFCFSRPSYFHVTSDVQLWISNFKFEIQPNSPLPKCKLPAKRLRTMKKSDSLFRPFRAKTGAEIMRNQNCTYGWPPFPTSLLDIPCSILDIQSHSCTGLEGGNLPLIGYSCLPAIMRIAGLLAVLTWRPTQWASSQNMAVQVRHRFPGIRSIVDDQAIAALAQPHFIGHFGRFKQ